MLAESKRGLPFKFTAIRTTRAALLEGGGFSDERVDQALEVPGGSTSANRTMNHGRRLLMRRPGVRVTSTDIKLILMHSNGVSECRPRGR